MAIKMGCCCSIIYHESLKILISSCPTHITPEVAGMIERDRVGEVKMQKISHKNKLFDKIFVFLEKNDYLCSGFRFPNHKIISDWKAQ